MGDRRTTTSVKRVLMLSFFMWFFRDCSSFVRIGNTVNRVNAIGYGCSQQTVLLGSDVCT